jgi:putative serine protease PepD
MYGTPARTRTRTLAAVGLAAAALGSAGAAATYALLDSDGPTTVVRQVTVAGAEPTAGTDAVSVADVYARTYKGVVEITVTSSASSQFPFGGPETQQAQGSGFVYDREGRIVTNQHVVDGADSISVTFWNGATYSAELVGSDASTDLAVIQVDAPASLLAPLALGDSSELAIGDTVLAIGSPFGLEGTMTSGIVSALHRQMTAPNGFTINDSIQTDAAINHGNSGGPLLDLAGQVVGVNAQIESEGGGNDGVGFAIPSATVESIVAQLVSGGAVEHAYLGVAVETIPASIASELGLVEGVEVTEVRPGTPADEAGLHAATGSEIVAGQEYPTGGDVITAIDGTRVKTATELQSLVDAKRPAETVTITFTREGESSTVQVELVERP